MRSRLKREVSGSAFKGTAPPPLVLSLCSMARRLSNWFRRRFSRSPSVTAPDTTFLIEDTSIFDPQPSIATFPEVVSSSSSDSSDEVELDASGPRALYRHRGATAAVVHTPVIERPNSRSSDAPPLPTPPQFSARRGPSPSIVRSRPAVAQSAGAPPLRRVAVRPNLATIPEEEEDSSSGSSIENARHPFLATGGRARRRLDPEAAHEREQRRLERLAAGCQGLSPEEGSSSSAEEPFFSATSCGSGSSEDEDASSAESHSSREFTSSLPCPSNR